MAAHQFKILWADDEIDLLRPHILFLEEKGYAVTSVNNGDDAVEYARSDRYDLIMLDEMMPGKDGLSALTEIRDFDHSIPIIMVTKNEEEQLMEDAIGKKITDYLTKPVNPSQILLTLKKIFDSKKITQERLSWDYSHEFSTITQQIGSGLTWDEWIDTYLKVINWEMELEQYPELGFQEMVEALHKECNINFCRFFESLYHSWIMSDDRPRFSVDVFPKWVFPHIKERKKSESLFSWTVSGLTSGWQWSRFFSIVSGSSGNIIILSYRLLRHTPAMRYSADISRGKSNKICQASGKRTKKMSSAATDLNISFSMSL